jgi:hydroxyacylglutathione hydrolase
MQYVTEITAPISFGFDRSEKSIPDLYIDEGYDLSGYWFDIKAIYFPGYSKGSLGIMSEEGDPFCGDPFTNEGKSTVNSAMYDKTAARPSLEKLKDSKSNRLTQNVEIHSL